MSAFRRLTVAPGDQLKQADAVLRYADLAKTGSFSY
jgi:hypothetical protein